MDRSRVVAVIPAFNESSTIASVVAAASKHVSVIVINDASSDETASLAETAGATVVSNARNLGYEASLNRGFDAALARGFDYIVTIDADGEHDPNYLADFAAALRDRQIPLVLGRRPHKQRWAEVVMGLYVQLRFGAHDILCGMKGYRADLIRQYGGIKAGGSIGTDLATHAIRDGHTFCEIAINGTRRKDTPRFGGLWRANMQIMMALAALIAADIAGCFSKLKRMRSGGRDD